MGPHVSLTPLSHPQSSPIPSTSQTRHPSYLLHSTSAGARGG
jgi:hypothetical protein